MIVQHSSFSRGRSNFKKKKKLEIIDLLIHSSSFKSVKVAYDHLKCRQPSSLTVYVGGNLERVTNCLENAVSMEKSLIALETYK